LGATNINWATVTNATTTVLGDDNSLTYTNVSGNQFSGCDGANDTFGDWSGFDFARDIARGVYSPSPTTIV